MHRRSDARRALDAQPSPHAFSAFAHGDQPEVLFVMRGETQTRTVTPTAEGTPEWIPLTQLEDYPLLDDLYAVIPLTLGDGPIFYGHYSPRADGSMSYRFTG